jgi:hypothetical protein
LVAAAAAVVAVPSSATASAGVAVGSSTTAAVGGYWGVRVLVGCTNQEWCEGFGRRKEQVSFEGAGLKPLNTNVQLFCALY